MSKPSVSGTRLLPSLACVGISFVLLLALHLAGFFSYFDTALYDYFLGLNVKHGPRPLNPQIVPIDLNDKSEKTLGERLNDRSAFADVFSVLEYSGAQVSLDFIYRGERGKDDEMVETAAALTAIMLAVIPVPEGRDSYRELLPEETALLRRHLWRPEEYGAGGAPRAGTFVMPFSELGEQATQLVHISIDPDPDGIFRRTPLFYAWEDGLVPSISLASALWELGIDGNDIEIHYGKHIVLPLGPDENIYVPIDARGFAVVPFGGKWEDTTHRYSFDTLAAARRDEALLDEVRSDLMGSLCFIADTTFEKKDLGPVPFEKVYLLSGLHTWMISAILDASVGEDSFFRDVPFLYRALCLLVFAAFFLFLGRVREDSIFNAVSAGLFLAFTLLVLCLWFFRRVMPWYGAGAAFVLFAWLSGFMFRFFAQQKRQTALERYVPRPVAQKLSAGQKMTLVPVHKELSIMFADIAGFTGWSAGRKARDVHEFLNDYLESMADILFAHNATVDKFMGDGILAFFGDPVELEDHAACALNAALAMQKKIRELREKWQPKAGIDLKVRVGINTGTVIVGDLGTRQRIEYTVIGSPVNLAQRMESLAPPGGILVTEYTRDALEDSVSAARFSFGEKQELAAKGYDKPVTAYELLFR